MCFTSYSFFFFLTKSTSHSCDIKILINVICMYYVIEYFLNSAVIYKLFIKQ